MMFEHPWDPRDFPEPRPGCFGDSLLHRWGRKFVHLDVPGRKLQKMVYFVNWL